MDFNIPNWTEEALHRAMTKEEFLADEEAQHLTAQYKLTKLLEKYSVEDVVAIWLSGQPLGVNNRADANGTTAFVYVDKVMRFYD